MRELFPDASQEAIEAFIAALQRWKDDPTTDHFDAMLAARLGLGHFPYPIAAADRTAWASDDLQF